MYDYEPDGRLVPFLPGEHPRFFERGYNIWNVIIHDV